MDNKSNLSPIDVNSTVQMFMTKEQIPLERLKRVEKKQEVQLSAYGQLQGLMQTFQTNLQQVSSAFKAVNYQISSSNPVVATASVTGNNVAPISHTLVVTQLAQAESQKSAIFTTNNAALNLTDSLAFSAGSTNFTINVSATDSLQNIRDNINNAYGNSAVTASIQSSTAVDGTAQYQLVISSNQSGTANAANVTDTNSLFGFTEATAAVDANFTFDAQPVVRSSNFVSDVMDGISFNLISTGTSTINITTSEPGAQVASVTSSIQTMLDSYNQALAFIDANQADPSTRNETFPLLKLNLQNAINTAFSGGGPFNQLGDIGIVVSANDKNQKTTTTIIQDKNGKDVKKTITYTLSGQLMLNTDPLLPTLSTALTNQFSAVQSFLTAAQNGILPKVNTLVDPLTGSITDTLRTNTYMISGREKMYIQQIADEDVRLKGVEANYVKKFSALNVLLEKLQKTTDYLTDQLRNLEFGRDK
ncbi:MAG: flagellar filament capping protein FliD [Gammaproteobacteria bacterium]|nr:flagellar filament capping protein FliD [Gammaproteobacteria bacterium]